MPSFAKSTSSRSISFGCGHGPLRYPSTSNGHRSSDASRKSAPRPHRASAILRSDCSAVHSGHADAEGGSRSTSPASSVTAALTSLATLMSNRKHTRTRALGGGFPPQSRGRALSFRAQRGAFDGPVRVPLDEQGKCFAGIVERHAYHQPHSYLIGCARKASAQPREPRPESVSHTTGCVLSVPEHLRIPGGPKAWASSLELRLIKI